MSNLDKMCYPVFIEYLKSKCIDYSQTTMLEIDHWFEECIMVVPRSNKLKVRYFSTDGGCQLF